jgi:hypothetical protein
MSAMARELVEKAGVGESADAVWRDLDRERDKAQPRHTTMIGTGPEEDSASLLEPPAICASQPAPPTFGLDLTKSPSEKRRKNATLWPTATEVNMQLSLFD